MKYVCLLFVFPSISSSAPKTEFLVLLCVFMYLKLMLLFKNIQYKILEDHDNISKLTKANTV